MSDPANELSVTRFIAAPPAAVWQAMTERMEEWWCPRPWRVEVEALERRPGGRWTMTMKGPDGEEMPTDGLILAWDEGRRIVSTDSVVRQGDEFAPAEAFMIGIWEIAPEGEGTRYTARARHWSDEARERHAAMGFVEGWKICADQLAELCEQPT